MVIFDLLVTMECHSKTSFDLEVGKVKHKHELNDASYTITIDTFIQSVMCFSACAAPVPHSLAAAACLHTRD